MNSNKPYFSNLSNTFTIKFDLKDLSNREKVSLFNALFRELGIADRVNEKPELLNSELMQVINKQTIIFWEKE